MAVNTTTSLSDVVKAAYDSAFLMGFAPQTYYRPFCNQGDINARAPQPGSSITWTKFGQLAKAKTPLPETGDPSSASLTSTQATATLQEYGNVVQRSQKLDLTSFTDVEAAAMMAVGINAGQTIDGLIADVALAGTNVVYAGSATSRNTITAADKITSSKIREVVARLRAASVPGIGDRVEVDGRVTTNLGSYYIGFIHPHVAKDLREETGPGGWRAPKEYADPSGIYNGEIGLYEGVRWIEHPGSEAIVPDAGDGGTVDVYRTLIFGWQYLGEGVGLEPQQVISGPFDSLQRLYNVGWKALIGFARVREESGFRIESASSMGANT